MSFNPSLASNFSSHDLILSPLTSLSINLTAINYISFPGLSSRDFPYPFSEQLCYGLPTKD